MIRSLRTLVVAALIVSSCGAEPPPLPAAGDAPSPAAAPPGTPPCRWEGYGIGLAPASQCNTMHLLAHAALTCSQAGGGPQDTRVVGGHCSGEAEEVQVSCCFPPPASPPITAAAPLDHLMRPLPGAAARAEVTALAEQSCHVAGTHLSDWSALYAPDGVSVDVLRFGCLP